MADSIRSQSPLRRECSSDDLQVCTPPQSEGLKAELEDQPQIGPFPVFGRPAAPAVESVDTHSLSLSWVPVQLEGCGGNRLEESDLPSCGVGYSLEMQLIGTVSVRLAEGHQVPCQWNLNLWDLGQVDESPVSPPLEGGWSCCHRGPELATKVVQLASQDGFAKGHG